MSEMSMISKSLMFAIVSFFALCAFVYLLLWFVSLGSLAGDYCIERGGYSLFHSELRCQMPYLILIGMASTLLFFICSLVISVRSKK